MKDLGQGRLATAPVVPRAARLKIFSLGSMRDGEATHRVHFLNISKTGALMHADRPPAVGATCTFGVVGNLGIAKVVWVDGKRFGIHFLVPLTDAALEAALRAG